MLNRQPRDVVFCVSHSVIDWWNFKMIEPILIFNRHNMMKSSQNDLNFSRYFSEMAEHKITSYFSNCQIKPLSKLYSTPAWIQLTFFTKHSLILLHNISSADELGFHSWLCPVSKRWLRRLMWRPIQTMLLSIVMLQSIFGSTNSWWMIDFTIHTLYSEVMWYRVKNLPEG